MNWLRKIVNCPLWVVAIVVGIIVYAYDKWQYSVMWERCQVSDMADEEAYAFVNHHSGMNVVFTTAGIVLLVWVLRKLMKRQINNDGDQ